MMDSSAVVRTSLETCAVTCPHCRHRTAVLMEQLRACRTVSCGCGQTLRLESKPRRFLRRDVRIFGELREACTAALAARVIITNLSLGGVGFEFYHRRLTEQECFEISFRLDDVSRAMIRELIVVRSVSNPHHASAAFILQGQSHFDLEFYLRPWTVLLSP